MTDPSVMTDVVPTSTQDPELTYLLWKLSEANIVGAKELSYDEWQKSRAV